MNIKTRGLDDRRQTIIETARMLFQTKDYADISMQEVVEKVGIAKGTIYYYFQSKEALLQAVVENIIDEDSARKQKVIEKTHGNALERMRALIQLEPIATKYPGILENMHKPGNAGMHTQLLAVTILKEAPLYAAVIRQGCDEGIFHTDNPLECAEFLISAVQFLTDLGIYPWQTPDLVRRAQAFPSLIEAVLKAPPGSFQFMTMSKTTT